MSVQLILKSSAVADKEVTANQLAIGELAINYHESGPFLQAKDTSGDVWRLGGVVIAATAPTNPSKGAWWLDSTDDTIYFYNGTTWIAVRTGQVGAESIEPGTANQLLRTKPDASGVEWVSNIDIPGTLDVTGAATFDGNLTVAGNLTINGSTTSLSSVTVEVEDKNIELGNVASPTDVTADGGGISLRGTTTKTFNWLNATDSWTSSEHLDLASGKAYYINGTEVLNATGLGSNIELSSGNIPAGLIDNSHISGTAAIAGSKIQAGTTSNSGVVQLNSSISSTSTTQAATPSAVKTANDTATAALPKAGGTMSGDIAMGSNKVTGLGTPTANTDATTKLYVDNAVAGANLTSINDADTSLSVTDSPTDSRAVVTVDGAEKLRVFKNGEIGLGGANYGTSGYVITSNGSGQAASWQEVKIAQGGGTDQVFLETNNTVTTNYTLRTNYNAVTAGPITINSGVTVTVPSGQSWVII